MPSLTLAPGRMIWFAHCPKAGGTSLERLMVETWGPAVGHLKWGWDLWWRRGGWREDGPPNSPQHLTWADATDILTHPPDAVFALVRDPMARMTSEHRFQRRLRRGTALGRLIAHLPFSLWLRLMLQVAARNPYAFDNHFRAQTDFVPEGAVVFRLENGMEGATEWLSEITGQRLVTPERRLVTSEGDEHRVDARDAALVFRVFAADYERFGYARLQARPSARPPFDILAAALSPIVVFLDRRGRL